MNKNIIIAILVVIIIAAVATIMFAHPQQTTTADGKLNTEIKFIDGDYQEQDVPLTERLEHANKRAFLSYAWGCWVTAWARFRLWEAVQIVGEDVAAQLRDASLSIYNAAAEYAATRGIIIADTKFEFGLDENGKVVLGDEMLTPDSSRFWPLEGYEPGHGQPSFDKQFVRDWLKANPDSDYLLPQDVIDKTIDKYKEAYHLLTGDTI